MLRRGLYLVAGSGGYSWLWCVGFSLRWLLLRRSTDSRPRTQESRPTGLIVPRHVESSQTRDETQVPCTARWILSYWTTTEAPVMATIYTAPTVGFPESSVGKESTHNAGDLGSIPGLGRSPGEGKGYPLQYSGLENSMDCMVHGVAKSRTQLSNFHFHFQGHEHQTCVLLVALWKLTDTEFFSSFFLSCWPCHSFQQE